MPIDLESIFAVYNVHRMGEDDLLCEPEGETCPTCGGLLLEDEREPFALYCPECDLVPK